MNHTPLLSICVPTYQRAALLRIMLQTLMPQASALGTLVEVCIADNASTDDTAKVVAASTADSPGVMVRYHRRDENLGAIRNVVRCVLEQATGEFVWAMGDDDLLTPGALHRMIDALRAHPEMNLFYANFASASFQAHWPTSAHSGYTGPIEQCACQLLQDRPIQHWQELLDSESSMGTQLYAHIVRRSIWTSYWSGRHIPPDYRTPESTYPHTAMLIDMAWDSSVLPCRGCKATAGRRVAEPGSASTCPHRQVLRCRTSSAPAA